MKEYDREYLKNIMSNSSPVEDDIAKARDGIDLVSGDALVMLLIDANELYGTEVYGRVDLASDERFHGVCVLLDHEVSRCVLIVDTRAMQDAPLAIAYAMSAVLSELDELCGGENLFIYVHKLAIELLR